MPWFTPQRVEAAADLRRYQWARSIVALAWPYSPAPRNSARAQAIRGRPRGRMAAYACLAQGDGAAVDYHDLLGSRCRDLAAWLRDRVPGARTKHFVDHGWALDRAIAERAGIGFTGKNGMLITPEAGSCVLLAALVVSVELIEDGPSRKGCGSCQACMPACPTGAITAPGVIDARRCISYLTIEHRGAIPPELRPLIGDWAFGCDLCQEACPINDRLAPPPLNAEARPRRRGPVPFPDLIECLELDDAAFTERFGRTAVSRTGRAGLARNCAIALGNLGDSAAVPALEQARISDADETVREAADWALSRLRAGSPAT
jgi:epoxyqueuosine reductase